MSQRRAKCDFGVAITGLALFFCFFYHFAQAATNSVPSPGYILPSQIGIDPDQSVNILTTFSDANGYADIKTCYLLVNTSLAAKNCLYAYYDRSTNKVYLRNDADSKWLGGYAPGAKKVIENSYVKLDMRKVSVYGSKAALNINWGVTFKPAFAGKKNAYLSVKDKANAVSGWITKGACYIYRKPNNPP
jgi:hypothetical protein